MIHWKNFSLFFLRFSLGWLLFYAGLSKLLDASWSAQGYLLSAQTFSGFYAWLASPQLIGGINLLNEWGLFLLGIALILGVFTRLSCILAILLMLLYYFPVLQFPYAGAHYFLIDEHIIFIAGFLTIAVLKAGQVFGLEERFKKLRI